MYATSSLLWSAPAVATVKNKKIENFSRTLNTSFLKVDFLNKFVQASEMLIWLS